MNRPLTTIRMAVLFGALAASAAYTNAGDLKIYNCCGTESCREVNVSTMCSFGADCVPEHEVCCADACVGG